MRLTRETDYAIRMVDYLARNNKTAGAVKIAEETKVPLRFAKNILQKLNKNQIVISRRGVYGGYRLGKKTEEISLYDVMEATGSFLILNYCVENQECSPYCEIFLKISLELEKRLREIKFSAVIQDLQPEKEHKEVDSYTAKELDRTRYYSCDTYHGLNSKIYNQ